MVDVPTQLIRLRRIGRNAPRGGVDLGEDKVRLFVWDDALGEIEGDIYRGYGKKQQNTYKDRFLRFGGNYFLM